MFSQSTQPMWLSLEIVVPSGGYSRQAKQTEPPPGPLLGEKTPTQPSLGLSLPNLATRRDLWETHVFPCCLQTLDFLSWDPIFWVTGSHRKPTKSLEVVAAHHAAGRANAGPPVPKTNPLPESLGTSGHVRGNLGCFPLLFPWLILEGVPF